MKSRIPHDYVPKINQIKTQEIKTVFIKSFIAKFAEKFNTLHLQVPMFASSKLGLNSFWRTGLRKINFDILFNEQIGELLQGSNKYLRYFATINDVANDTNILTTNTYCIRDSVTSNITSNIHTKINIFSVGKKTTSEEETNIQLVHYVDLINESLATALKNSSFNFKISKKISLVDDQNLHRLYNHLLYFERINRICYEKKNIFLTRFWSYFEKNTPLENFILDEWDWNTGGKFYHYYSILKEAVNFLRIGNAVNEKRFEEQLDSLSISKDSITSVYHKLLIENKLRNGNLIEINVDEILMVALSKMNIAELNSSNFDQDLKKMMEKKKIHIV